MDKLRIVRDMESEPHVETAEREILGLYVGKPDEGDNIVIYMTPDGVHHSAPEDCVQIEDAPEGYEASFFGDGLTEEEGLLPPDVAGPVAGHTDRECSGHSDGVGGETYCFGPCGMVA